MLECQHNERNNKNSSICKIITSTQDLNIESHEENTNYPMGKFSYVVTRKEIKMPPKL